MITKNSETTRLKNVIFKNFIQAADLISDFKSALDEITSLLDNHSELKTVMESLTIEENIIEYKRSLDAINDLVSIKAKRFLINFMDVRQLDLLNAFNIINLDVNQQKTLTKLLNWHSKAL